MIKSRTRSRQPPREPWTLERLVTERSISLGFALDKSTSLAYSSALNSYLAFCSMHGFDPEPSVDTLSFYVTYMSHHIEPRSVRTYLTGIVSELEAFYPHVREIRQSSVVARTLKGSLRRFSSPVRQKEPLTRDDLVAVARAMPLPASHDDLLFCTLLQTGFFGLNRLGELVWPDNPALQSFSKISWRASVTLSPTSYSFDLRRHKVDARFEGSTVVVQQSAVEPDPLDTFTRYLNSRDSRFPLHPQLWLRNDGSTPLRSWFLRRLHHFFPQSIGGHSLRAGGATSLAAAGVLTSQIQSIGRWKSTAFERYIRRHPTVLQALIFHGRAVHDPPFAAI